MSSEFVIFLTGCSVALSAVILGTYLNISRQSLLGDALSHSLLPGLVLAHLVTGELNPTALFFGALIAGLATGYVIEFIGKRFRVREDIAMGITFTAAFSLGVLLLVRYANKSHIDTDCLLFGNLLFVPLEESFFSFSFLKHIPMTLFQSSVISLLSVFFYFLLHRPFMNLLFHENSFKLSQLPGNFLKSLFLTLVSLTIVFGFKAMGALLVFGLFVIPVGIGRIFNKSFLGISTVGFCSAILSLWIAIRLSFNYDLSPSAAWISLLFVMFITVFLVSKIPRRRDRALKEHST
ncbi:MAG: metal ABC transporter permease [Bdellovibrionota bacterium]